MKNKIVSSESLRGDSDDGYILFGIRESVLALLLLAYHYLMNM